MLTVTLFETLQIAQTEYAQALMDWEAANTRLNVCRDSLNEAQLQLDIWFSKIRDEAPPGSNWDKKRPFKDSRIT